MVRKLVLILVLFAASPYIFTQTVDEIVQKNLQASGGVDALKSKNSVRLTGTLKVQGMELPMTIYRKRPGMLRTDVTVEAASMVDAFDGTQRWKILPFGGNKAAEKATPEETADMKEQSDFDPQLLDYKTRGRQLELSGKESVDGKEVYKLKMTLASGATQDLFVDAATFLIVKQLGRVHTPQGEQPIQTMLSDHRMVDGISLPFRIQTKVGDTTEVEILVQKVEWNVDIPDSLFKMPAK